MLEYAEHQFWLDRAEEDGSALRDHLASAAERGNVRAAALLGGPELPKGSEYLWTWFRQLSRHRASGSMGLSSLTWTDFASWMKVTRIHLVDWELETIGYLDSLYMHVSHAKNYTSEFAKEFGDLNG